MHESWRESWYYHRRSRPNRPHEIHWLEPASGVRRTRGFPKKHLALRYKQRVDQWLNNWLLPAAETPFLDAVLAYAQDLADAGGAAPRHLAGVATTLRMFAEHCRPSSTRDFSAQAVTDYFHRRRQVRVRGRQREPRPLAAATLQREWRTLHAFAAFCVARGWLPENPLKKVSKPRVPDSVVRVPAEEDWLRLLEVLNRAAALAVTDRQGWHLLILLGVLTGLDAPTVLLDLRFGVPQRLADRGEVLNYVELGGSDGVGLVRSRRKKTSRAYLFGLPPEINDRLARRIDALPDGCDRLFPHWRSWPRRQWAALGRAAAFDLPFRALRRASGTQAALAQAESAAQQHLGHSTPLTTRRHYLQNELLAKAIARQLPLPALPPMPPYAPPGR